MEKVEKVSFSVAVVLFDMKMHSDPTPKKFYRSRLLGDLGKRSQCQLSVNIFKGLL